MEIFSPGPVPYPGCYQCPRCNSREVYDSEKTINVSAITIDVPGPASSTIINRDRIHAKRCRHCNTEAPWLAHPKAVEEANERKAQKLKKILKVVGIVLGAIVGIMFAANILNSVRGNIESNNFEKYRSEGNQKLEEVRSEWQSAYDACNIGITNGDRGVDTREVRIEKIRKDQNYEYSFQPKIDIYYQIEAEEYPAFWSSEKGQAFDCFAEKIYGAKLSEKLTLTDSQVKDRKESFKTIDFYDGVESDGTIYSQGVIGDQDEHLDGYLFYSDSFGDQFSISMTWDLDRTCFRVQGESTYRYSPDRCKSS